MRDIDSDTDLIALLRDAQQDDSAALHLLLAEIYPAVLLYARRRVKGMRDAGDRAEDVTQEVLLRIVQKLHTCNASTPSSLFAWALAITRNAAIDMLRQHHGEAEWIRSVPDFDALQEDFSFAGASPDAGSAESDAGWVLSALVDRILGTLSPGTQRVLHLRAQHKLTWPEIASAVQTTAAGAKRRFQRAQADLRVGLAVRVQELPAHDRRHVLRRLHWMGISLPVDAGD